MMIDVLWLNMNHNISKKLKKNKYLSDRYIYQYILTS